MRSGDLRSIIPIILVLLCLFCLVFHVLLITSDPNPPPPFDKMNFSPTFQPDRESIVERLRGLGCLEIAHYYTREEVLLLQNNGTQGTADNEAFICLDGHVIAGVNLSQMESQDVALTNDNRVVLFLPPPEVFAVTLGGYRIGYNDCATDYPGVDPTPGSVPQQIADRIKQNAIENGILSSADANARIYLNQLITAYGFQDVIYIFPTPTPAPGIMLAPNP